jgi:hypothetical protein
MKGYLHWIATCLWGISITCWALDGRVGWLLTIGIYLIIDSLFGINDLKELLLTEKFKRAGNLEVFHRYYLKPVIRIFLGLTAIVLGFVV